MTLRIAFVGFRHAHIFDLYRRTQEMDDFEVVAACEEDKTARQTLASSSSVVVTHDCFDDMLDSVPCDIVAVGDYYAKRGQLVVRALERGKHVIGDKPLCTTIAALDRIAALAHSNQRVVGCMLDLRDAPQIIGLRRLIGRGDLGEIHAVTFGGQHPLQLGQRPSWYFEPGKHGGTINDIAIHAFDVIPWITGLSFAAVAAARCWNARVPQYPCFEDCGQVMLSLDNGGGVLGDVSYLMPDGIGYATPLYWRMTFWGGAGVAETSYSARELRVARAGDGKLVDVALPAGNPGGYLRAFLHEIRRETAEGELVTSDVLCATRVALTAQLVADQEESGTLL
ncbi:MAG: Gfo/Idh/MocA family oxidoreductase [Anaerolineae bacterium]|nr:Gfo/Idh/MocA family oxidoreductase [Anaerolineae bacterium]